MLYIYIYIYINTFTLHLVKLNVDFEGIQKLMFYK